MGAPGSASGVQLHISSLPDGKVGRSSHRFIRWLEAAGQSWWQVNPLGPPGTDGSPYGSSSAFAGWEGHLGARGRRVTAGEIDDFLARNPEWAPDMLVRHGRAAVAGQVRFDRAWAGLRAHAHDHGVRLLGDLPYEVALRGDDRAAHPDLFLPGMQGGVPPDAFSATGQLWGTAVYDWRGHRAAGFAWWIARLRRAGTLYDMVRLDHFRGFVAAWAVPEGARDARAGAWLRAPGRELFAAAIDAHAMPAAIAEDLGVITPPVEALRRHLGLPGMRVLQFGLGIRGRPGPHDPRTWPADVVGYIGTHDNDTAVGWWRSLDPARRARLAWLDGPDVHWRLIEVLAGSPARLVIVQAQDVLGLGHGARMNDPARRSRQWRFRLPPGAPDARAARALRAITRDAGRLPDTPPAR